MNDAQGFNDLMVFSKFLKSGFFSCVECAHDFGFWST